MSRREARRAKRLAILSEIERLNKKRCKHCAGYANSQKNNSYCVCAAATEIRRLGDSLLETTPRARNNFRLTAAEYIEMKQKGLKDRDIAQLSGIGINRLSNWKKANGLSSITVKSVQEEVCK